MADTTEIRLRILETLIPHATRVGVTNPETIIESCTKFENYVVGSDKTGGSKPAPSGQDGKKKPRRG